MDRYGLQLNVLILTTHPALLFTAFSGLMKLIFFFFKVLCNGDCLVMLSHYYQYRAVKTYLTAPVGGSRNRVMDMLTQAWKDWKILECNLKHLSVMI